MNQSMVDMLKATVTSLDDNEAHAKVMIYGESGVGKTILACTLGERILFIDSSVGWVSLKNHPELLGKIDRMQYEGISQIEALCDAVESGDEYFSKYDTIVVDELSSIAQLDLDTVIKSRAAKDPNKDPNVPTQPDFYASTERVRRAVSRLISLPMNIVLTAHTREDRDERSGRMYIRPSFTPKLRQTILQQLHLCGYLTSMEINETLIRRLQIQPSSTVTAKTRIAGTEAVVDNPDLSVIFASWQVRNEEAPMLQEPDAPVAETDVESDSLSI